MTKCARGFTTVLFLIKSRPCKFHAVARVLAFPARTKSFRTFFIITAAYLLASQARLLGGRVYTGK